MIQIQVSHTWESSVPVYKDWESAVLDSCLGFLWLFVSYKKKRNFLTGSSLCVVVWSWIWGSSVLRSLNLFKVLDTFPIFPHWKKKCIHNILFWKSKWFLVWYEKYFVIYFHLRQCKMLTPNVKAYNFSVYTDPHRTGCLFDPSWYIRSNGQDEVAELELLISQFSYIFSLQVLWKIRKEIH